MFKLFSIIVAVISFFLSNVSARNFIQDDREMIAFGKATKELMQKLSAEFRIVTIVIFGDAKQLSDEIDAIVRSSDGEIIFEILKDSQTCNFNCILLFDSMKMFNKRYEIYETLSKLKVVVAYIRHASFNEISAQITETWKVDLAEMYNIYTQNLFILHRNIAESLIDLIAAIKFTQNHGECQQSWMVKANRFSAFDLKWQPPLHKLKFIDNLQGYSVHFSSNALIDGLEIGPSKLKFSHKQGNYTLSGYMIHIIDELAKIGNFKPNYQNIEKIEKRSKQHNNFTPQVTAGELGMNVQEALVNSLQSQAIVPLIYKELYFIIPPAERLTELEILFLAFDVATWSMILLTLLVAFIVVAIIGFTSQSVSNFVFGKNVSTPSLNILAAFFGVSQIVLPKRNFARFLLMAFIMWSLLIRTCYFSVLFEYLKGDGRKAPIKSIDEMLDRNFTYFIFQEHCFRIGNMNLTGR